MGKNINYWFTFTDYISIPVSLTLHSAKSLSYTEFHEEHINSNEINKK